MKAPCGNNTKVRHLGLDMLRAWMCFEVVFVHFYSSSGSGVTESVGRLVQMTSRLAVPEFMILSFFFPDIRLMAKNTSKFRHRLRRLLTPLVVWAVVYWILYSVNPLRFDALRQLFWQILLGHTLNESMWYQSVVVLVTVILVGIAKFSTDRRIECALLAFAGIALLFELSEVNYYLFSAMPRHLGIRLGRICEMIPFAVMGCFFHDRSINRNKSRIIGLALVLSGIWLLFVLLEINPEGFKYNEPFQIVLAPLLFTIVESLPNRYIPTFAQKLITPISKYTLGIYCIHRLVANQLFQFKYFAFVQNNHPFFFCTILFAICWLICYLLAKLPFSIIRNAVC